MRIYARMRTDSDHFSSPVRLERIKSNRLVRMTNHDASFKNDLYDMLYAAPILLEAHPRLLKRFGGYEAFKG
jgi:hypothetical protein